MRYGSSLFALMLAGTLSAAGTDGETRPLKALTVALYHGGATRESVRFLMEYYRSEAPYRLRPEVDNAVRFLSEAEAAVSRSFGAAKNVERVEEAARAGADLSAVIEVRAGFKRNLRLEKHARVAFRVEFLDLAGKGIAVLESESVQAPIVDAKVKVRKDLYREFAQALDEAAALLEAEVRASPELAAFAARKDRAAPLDRSAADRALSSEVDSAAHRLPVEPTAVAWVVGVEHYEDGGSAPHAERDAAAVRNQLIGLGWPDRNVLWLTGRRAQRAELRRALETFQRRGAGAAKAFVFFSGISAESAKKGRTELLAWDGGRISLEDVVDAVAGLGAGAAFVVVDGAASLGRPRPGVALMSAAVPGENRQVDGAQGHGLFTLEFLRALTSASDKKGQVTARAAFERASARVREASAGRQNPAWSAPPETDPVLVLGSSRER